MEAMDAKLVRGALVKLLAGVVLVGLLLFVPAGSLDYRAGWILMGILFIPMLLAGIVMLAFKPDLLRKRLQAREEQAEQRGVIAASGLMFLAAFVVAGLTYRFGWISFPAWTELIGVVLFLAGYLLFAEVLRESEYLSRTVEVQEGQRVVDTGLYGIVRHPMYAATLLLFLSMPLVLDAPLSLVIMLAYLPIISRRIANEEQVLERGLPGYRAYKERVRHRIIPFVW